MAAAQRYAHARSVGEDELERFCGEARKVLTMGERGPHCMETVQQLHAFVKLNRRPTKLPQALIETLYAVLTEPEQGSSRLRLLCASLLRDLAPSRRIQVEGFGPPVDRKQIPLLLPVVLCQGKRFNVLGRCLPEAVQWLVGNAGLSETEIRLFTASFVAAVARNHPSLISRSPVPQLNAYFLSALRYASINVAPDPDANRGLFSAAPTQQQVTEFDDTQAREFFTVLNISSSKIYAQDQVLNVHMFGLLRGWLESVYMNSATGDAAKHGGGGAGNAQDVGAGADAGGRARSSRILPGQEPLTQEFKNGVVEYCLKLLDQSSLKLTGEHAARITPHNRSLLQAVPAEVVRIFDILCTLDSSMITKLFPDIKRLFSRGAAAAGGAGPSLKLALLDFFMKHGDAIVYDIKPSLDSFFGATLSVGYHDPVTAMDTLLFCLRHHTRLRSSVFVKFFPNIFKLLAWSPRSYLGEFLEMLPCLMSPSTCIEVLHTILDLPVLSAALEHSRSGSVDAISSATPIAGALINYIMREEGGLGGTIDRLEVLHELMADFSGRQRVQVAAQIVPTLLRVFFISVAKEASYKLVYETVSVILERVRTLYSIDRFRADVRKVLAEQMLSLFQRYPQLIVDLRKELLEFVGTRRNVGDGREEFFVHVVWVIGEYAGPTLDPRCTNEIIDQYHEVLELFAYEINALVDDGGAADGGQYSAVHTARLMTVLMFALSKLATRCQDLIPRVALCLTKIIKQHSKTSADVQGQHAVLERATQLVRTLQRPSVAAAVLARSGTETTAADLRHSDPTSSLALLRFSAVGQ